MNGLNYFGVVLMGLGGLILLWTLRALVRRRALLRNPVQVEGVVIGVRIVRSMGRDTAGSFDEKFYPTVRYQAEEGEIIERELPPTRDSTECQIGAVVGLVYQRGNPANVVYADMRWRELVWSVIGSLIILGIGALLRFCVEPTSTKPTDVPTSAMSRE